MGAIFMKMAVFIKENAFCVDDFALKAQSFSVKPIIGRFYWEALKVGAILMKMSVLLRAKAQSFSVKPIIGPSSRFWYDTAANPLTKWFFVIIQLSDYHSYVSYLHNPLIECTLLIILLADYHFMGTILMKMAVLPK